MAIHIIYMFLGFIFGVGALELHRSIALDKCRQVIYYIFFPVVTGLLFYLVAYKIDSSEEPALLCILLLIFHFIILNKLKGTEIFPVFTLWAIIGVVVLIGVCIFTSENAYFFVFYPVATFLGLCAIKYTSRLLMSFELLRNDEIIIASISSSLLCLAEGNILVSYIILIAAYYLCWALCCRVVNKMQFISFIPAIEASLMTCIFSSNLAIIVRNIIQ